MLIERSRSRLASVLAGAILLSLLAATPVLAQQEEPPQAEPQQAPPAGAQPPAQAAPAAPTDRVGRLEQQIADLQAMVAALESLVKQRPDVTLPQEGAPGDAGAGIGSAAGITARIDALETQIGALSSQLELMTQQLGALEARIGGAGAPQQLAPPQAEEPPMAPPPQGDDALPELPGREGRAPANPSAPDGRGA
jgi:TolA-binding protein